MVERDLVASMLCYVTATNTHVFGMLRGMVTFAGELGGSWPVTRDFQSARVRLEIEEIAFG
jgi:hypothetical protein